jgi:tripartite ATP-independent transporter DctM subunit
MQGANQTAQMATGNFAPRPVSVGDLYAGALLPSLLLVGLYLGWVGWVAWRHPERAPALVMSEAERRGLPLRVLTALVAPLLLVLAVLGSILAGIATATESASLGAVAVVAFAALRGRLSGTVLREATLGTAATSTMIFVILLGASTFSLVFRGLGGEALVEEALRATPGGAFGAMLVFMLVMFVLGFFLDTFEIIFIMLPIFGPPLLKLGYDPVWLGVMVGINLQTSFLTPPFGATLFYMRGVAPPEITTSDIWVSSIPWTWLQLAGLAAVWAFPAIATWLPARVFG